MPADFLFIFGFLFAAVLALLERHYETSAGVAEAGLGAIDRLCTTLLLNGRTFCFRAHQAIFGAACDCKFLFVVFVLVCSTKRSILSMLLFATFLACCSVLLYLPVFYVLFDLRSLIASLAAKTVAVIVKVLRMYTRFQANAIQYKYVHEIHEVAYRGVGAILSVAWSDQAIQQRFVAAGARELVEAFRDDYATQQEAKEEARRTLGQLISAGGCEGGWASRQELSLL